MVVSTNFPTLKTCNSSFVLRLKRSLKEAGVSVTQHRVHPRINGQLTELTVKIVL